MPSVGIGLIGLGHHGLRYATHLLEPIPQGRLVAVCRRNEEMGKAYATQHGLRFYQDYRDLIADSHVDAVIVVASPTLTLPIALEAIRHHKPLLIEKPLAVTGEQAREIVDKADQAHVPIMTAHTLRYENSILAMKEACRDIGARQYLVLTNRVEKTRQSDRPAGQRENSGVLLEIGIHLLDLVRFLTGEEVREVFCEMGDAGQNSPEERAWVHLKTDSGLPCLLDVSWMSASRVTRGEIIGETGQLVADWTSHSLYHIFKGGQTQRKSFPPDSTIPKVVSGFLDAILKGIPMPISGLDGQRAVEIADACYESAHSGQVIQLSREQHSAG